jgi:hypothetical protein
MTPTDREIPWPATEIRSPRTEIYAPPTQIAHDREDYLGQGLRDVGRRIAADQVEMFVDADPAAALLQEFERLAPEFMALHDVGRSATLHLLGALAGSAGARVQRLSVRRQGQGVALAVVQFVELPLGEGRHVRVYSTDINADTLTRQQIATVLLSRSRLAVLMLGDLPAQSLSNALGPLREAIARGPWPNRDMLLLPLGAAAALAAQASQLVGSSGVTARVTPQAARPDTAWTFISGAWNRLQAQGAGPVALHTDLAQAMPRPAVPKPDAPTEAMPLMPLRAATTSATSSAATPAPATPSRWDDYAQRCAAVRGVVSCCVFDLPSQQPLAQAGGPPGAQALALRGSQLLQSLSDAAHGIGLALGPGMVLPEAAISFGTQHLLLRPVPGHPGVVLHLVLQASSANLTLARLQLDRVPLPA